MIIRQVFDDAQQIADNIRKDILDWLDFQEARNNPPKETDRGPTGRRAKLDDLDAELEAGWGYD